MGLLLARSGEGSGAYNISGQRQVPLFTSFMHYATVLNTLLTDPSIYNPTEMLWDHIRVIDLLILSL